MRYTLNQTSAGLDIEAARCAYSNPPRVATNLLACFDFGLHHVSGLEAFDAFGTGQIATHASKLIQPGALVRLNDLLLT